MSNYELSCCIHKFGCYKCLIQFLGSVYWVLGMTLLLQVVILSENNGEKYLIDRQEVDAKHDL